jgi:hypothetical protein
MRSHVVSRTQVPHNTFFVPLIDLRARHGGRVLHIHEPQQTKLGLWKLFLYRACGIYKLSNPLVPEQPPGQEKYELPGIAAACDRTESFKVYTRPW